MSAYGNVLVAEDDHLVALALRDALQASGWERVEHVASVAQGLAALRARRPDLALLDIQLADGPTTPLAEALAATTVPFLVLTGHPCDGFAEPALRAAPCLHKPCGLEQLQAAIGQLLGR
jgi:DNA-binding response OmpR family regulator